MNISKNQSTVTEYFSKNPFEYAEHYKKETPEGYSFRIRKEQLLKSLGGGNGAVLDIGCGPAVMTKEITDLGWKYVGIDISLAMIEEAKKRTEELPWVHFQVGTVEHIASENESFDVVVAMGLVEYVDDDEIAIREMSRVLKNGGKLIVSLPNRFSPVRLWDRHVLTPIAKFVRLLNGKKTKNIFHREYIPSRYKKLLEKNGFINVRIVAYNIRLLPRPFDGWFPYVSVFLSKTFEWLITTSFWWLATGVNVEATKHLP